MRGRGGYDGEAFLTSPRRKPVHIEDIDHVYTGARKAARISDFASEDSEDLSRRSHNKDRKLLDGITHKLVNSTYIAPVSVHRTSARRPPVAPVGRKPVTPRRVGIRPVPSLSSAYRASSVPPYYVEEEVTTPYNFYEVAPSSSYYRPPYLNYQPRYGVARAHSEPPLTRSSTLAVKNARRCLDRIERELGFESDYDYAPAVQITREPVVRARTAVRSGAGVRAGVGAGAVRRRPGSQPPPVSRSRISQSEIDREVEEYLEQPFVRPSLRARAASLDRSSSRVPAPIVSTSLVRARADSLERMPGLDPYRSLQGSARNNPGSGSTYTAIAPYVPARVTSRPHHNPGAGLPPKAPVVNFHPEMSDTRKRIREVLCMTKRDPHYFS